MIITTRPYIKFHNSTSDAWDAMLDACSNARKSIELEEYIFTPDAIGSKFIEIFLKKAEEGVRIRLIFDMVGSLSLYLSDIPTHLREKGIEVVFFNPISLWRIGNITSHFFRDHRKLLVVDNELAFIGGVGIQDRMEGWRDTMVELHSELTENISYIFDLMWRRIESGKYRRFGRPPHYHKHYEISINSPRFGQRFIYYTYLAEIRDAKQYIHLTTPYFIPDRRLLRALRVAAHRGVDVRIIIPKTSDVFLIDSIQAWYITHSLRAGIKVYTYSGDFYHAKMGIIDGNWATVGSLNLDNLSLVTNHEANLVSTDLYFVEGVESSFQKDLALTEEIEYEVWNKRFFLWKIIEVLTWPLHGFY